MDLRQRLSDAFGWEDAALAAAGVLGLLFFLVVGPREYPDSVASVHIPREEAIDRARSFAETAAKLELEDAEVEAQIERRRSLLDTLQLRLGRHEAMRRIRKTTAPAYFWSVTWGSRDSDGRVNAVNLTLLGEPIGITTVPGVGLRVGRHDDALATVTFDSLMGDRLSFQIDGDDAQGAGHILTRSDAVGLARYHLGNTALSNQNASIDSVFASGEEGVLTATVRMRATDPKMEEWQTVDVEVMPTGALASVAPVFTLPAEESEIIPASALFEISFILVLAGLCIVMIVVFFRRINARLVDPKSALRDAALAGVAASLAATGQIVGAEAHESTVELIFILVGTVFIGLSAAALFFFISGAVTSVARDTWEEKLRSLDLARRLFIRNRPVGLALTRGTLAGFAMLGAVILLLMLVPSVAVSYGDEGAYYSADFPVLMGLRQLGGKFFFALLTSYAGAVGVGALLRQRTRKPVVPVIGVVIALSVLQISPIDLRPLIATFTASAILAGGAAWLLFRHDVLTTTHALFVLFVVPAALTGWSVPTSPEFTSAIVILAAVGIVFAIGLSGALSQNTAREMPFIVPEYIEELAQRERLKRELEIAREVQVSFLPAGNPQWPGLDIASVCLPAQEVGGDYYDFFRIDNRRLGMVVGDVSGKGLQAAFYMTLMKGILQSMVSDTRGPADVISRANELFRMNAPRGAFMSMILGTYETESQTWTFARAGHNPLLIQRAAAARPDVIKPNGAAIGLTSGVTFTRSLEERSISLAAGDLVLIYTDGVTEAMNERRDLYDDDRLLEVVGRCRGQTAAMVIEAIVDDVDAFSGSAPRHDDMTMVAFRVLPAAEVQEG